MITSEQLAASAERAGELLTHLVLWAGGCKTWRAESPYYRAGEKGEGKAHSVHGALSEREIK